MPIVTNTFQSTSSVTNREELSDIVSRITPEDTPIYSMHRKGTCKTTHPEWAVDVLDAPAENIQLEGDEYDFDAITPPTRYGNYTQIMRRTGIISGTQESTDEAGSVLKIKEQKLRSGVVLRKDVELAIVTSNASVAGATREFGSLPTWIETNVSRGSGGANGGFNSGDGLTDVPTDGTQRAFTKAIMDDVMQQGYESGANFKYLTVSPYVKSVFVTIMSDSNVAPFRHDVKDGNNNVIIANADMYHGPFGKITVVPNRVMATSAGTARNAFFSDPEFLEFCWFRKIKEDKNASRTITGDHKKFVLLGEGTLKVKNEMGLGVAADLFGLTAST